MPVQIFLAGTVRHSPYRTTLNGQAVQVFSLAAEGDRYLIVEPASLDRQPGDLVAVGGHQFLVREWDQSGLPLTVPLVWSYLSQPFMADRETALRLADEYSEVAEALTHAG